MANKHAPNVVNAIRGLQAKAQAITNNRELSPLGQQTQLAAVQKEAAALRASVLTGLKIDWSRARRESQRLDDAQRAAEAEAAASWDYNALNYEAQAVRAAIRGMHDFTQIAEAYQAAANSGNRAKARAWAEIGPGEIEGRFSGTEGIDANRLVLQMQKAAAELTQPPSLKAILAERSNLAAEALELLSVTREAGEYYDRHNWDLGDFGRLTENVSVSRKMDPVSGGLLTTVEIGPEPEERAPVDFQANRERLGLI